MNKRQISYPINDRWSYLWLVVATVLTLFSLSAGRWLLPIAAWTGSIFYL